MIGNASFCRPASVATAVLLWGMGAGVVPSVASAAGRVALVVGNGAYAEIGTLPNPGNDAADVAAALGRLGFEVETVRDADRAGMNAALRGFTRRSVGADVALVFYAGHGLEMDGVNYLVPVDARLERDTDVRFEAVALDDVLASVEGAALRVVILDACRNNPLARSMQLTNASRSVSRGSFGELNEDLLGAETLVAYAAAAGTTAADGTGRNSPYTSALLAYLEQPLELSALFRRVRAQVLDATRGEQRPHEYASLLDEHYLRGASGPGTVTAAAQPSSETRAQQETVFWQSIASSRNPADFEAYLQQFPNGVFARLARNRMAELGTGSGDPPMAEQPRPVRRVPVTSGVVVVRAVDARGPGRVHAMSGEIALGFVTGQVSGAARVVTSLGDIDVPKTALVVTDGSGAEYEANVLRHYTGGLTAIDVEGLTAPAYPFARDSAAPGQPIFGATLVVQGITTLVPGRVVSLSRSYLQHNAYSEQRQNAGAPLLNLCGQIVGTVLRSLNPNALGQGIAVPAETVRSYFAGYLGATIAQTPCE